MNKVVSGLWKGGASAPPYRGPQDKLFEMSGRAFATGLKPRPSERPTALVHQPARDGPLERAGDDHCLRPMPVTTTPGSVWMA